MYCARIIGESLIHVRLTISWVQTTPHRWVDEKGNDAHLSVERSIYEIIKKMCVVFLFSITVGNRENG